MNNSVQSIDNDDPAEIILAAAVNRFSNYGYNKTTMAEIAEDAGMSAANIYRYYKIKKKLLLHVQKTACVSVQIFLKI